MVVKRLSMLTRLAMLALMLVSSSAWATYKLGLFKAAHTPHHPELIFFLGHGSDPWREVLAQNRYVAESWDIHKENYGLYVWDTTWGTLTKVKDGMHHEVVRVNYNLRPLGGEMRLLEDWGEVVGVRAKFHTYPEDSDLPKRVTINWMFEGYFGLEVSQGNDTDDFHLLVSFDDKEVARLQSKFAEQLERGQIKFLDEVRDWPIFEAPKPLKEKPPGFRGGGVNLFKKGPYYIYHRDITDPQPAVPGESLDKFFVDTSTGEFRAFDTDWHFVGDQWMVSVVRGTFGTELPVTTVQTVNRLVVRNPVDPSQFEAFERVWDEAEVDEFKAQLRTFRPMKRSLRCDQTLAAIAGGLVPL